MSKHMILFWFIIIAPINGFCKDNNADEPDEFLRYKSIKEGALKIHLFKPQKHSFSDNNSAIVFFSGGGWKNCNPSQFYPHCSYLSSRGMVAMSAEYRVENIHETPPSKCVEDGKSAIRWIRKNADQLGIDPNRIVASGGSAGGQVAAATGTLSKFNDPSDDLSVSCIPNALVLFNPVFDNSKNGYGYERVKEYWRDFSPLHNLSKDTPPTIIFFGTKDKYHEHAKLYKHRMKQLGLRCELYLYKGQSHGFFNYQHTEYYRKTIIELDKFLISLNYIKEKKVCTVLSR